MPATCPLCNRPILDDGYDLPHLAPDPSCSSFFVCGECADEEGKAIAASVQVETPNGGRRPIYGEPAPGLRRQIPPSVAAIEAGESMKGMIRLRFMRLARAMLDADSASPEEIAEGVRKVAKYGGLLGVKPWEILPGWASTDSDNRHVLALSLGVLFAYVASLHDAGSNPDLTDETVYAIGNDVAEEVLAGHLADPITYQVEPEDPPYVPAVGEEQGHDLDVPVCRARGEMRRTLEITPSLVIQMHHAPMGVAVSLGTGLVHVLFGEAEYRAAGGPLATPPRPHTFNAGVSISNAFLPAGCWAMGCANGTDDFHFLLALAANLKKPVVLWPEASSGLDGPQFDTRSVL